MRGFSAWKCGFLFPVHFFFYRVLSVRNGVGESNWTTVFWIQ